MTKKNKTKRYVPCVPPPQPTAINSLRPWPCLHQPSDLEYWYNTSWHSALGHSAFYVLYGHQSRHFGVTNLYACNPSSLSEWLQEKSAITSLISQHLAHAQLRMKHHANKLHSQRQFAIGDWVYLKLQPYIQTSLVPRANQKLLFKCPLGCFRFFPV